ncbi:MAG: hypothetical protein OEY49_18825 [Candidatus Heimdallarchaeota archaeon]|nr:hypothetical protein [Candidatus Heimdallarchaeota archaeon]
MYVCEFDAPEDRQEYVKGEKRGLFLNYMIEYLEVSFNKVK